MALYRTILYVLVYITLHYCAGDSLPAPSNVTAVQDSATSILVSWSSSIFATGYTIFYNSSGGDRGSVDVGGGSAHENTLTGLQNGDTYTISIIATSDSDLFSESVTAMDIGLGKSTIGYLYIEFSM